MDILWSNIVSCGESMKLYEVYTGDGLKGSGELNMAWIEYFYSELPFYNVLFHEKSTVLMNAFATCKSENCKTTELKVYHGTEFLLHESPSQQFTTFAFFSTTIDKNIAKTYCKNNYIYEITLPANFPYIKLDDANKQILLPIGTLINQIKNDSNDSTDSTGVLHYKCNAVLVNDRIQNICNVLERDVSNKPINVNIDEGSIKYFTDELNIKVDNAHKGSSTFYSCQEIGSSVGKAKRSRKCVNKEDRLIIKDIIKKTDKQINIKNNDYVCRRLMNEMLASIIYRKIFKCSTLNYFLMKGSVPKNDNLSINYFIASKELTTIVYTITGEKIARKVLQGFIVDCIMSNWDAYNNKNIGFDKAKDDVIVRTDVGGSLAYRGKGDFNYRFFTKTEDLNDHIMFLTDKDNPSVQFVKQCFTDAAFKNAAELDEILYSNLNETTILDTIGNFVQTNIHDSSNDYTPINIFYESYESFMSKIVDIIKKRCAWYIRNKAKVISEIKGILKESGILGGNSKSHLTYCKKNRRVYTLDKNRYIMWDKKKLFLTEIKGKYRFVQTSKSLGGGSEETICVPLEENDVITGSDEVFAEQLNKCLPNLPNN